MTFLKQLLRKDMNIACITAAPPLPVVAPMFKNIHRPVVRSGDWNNLQFSCSNIAKELELSRKR